MKFSLVVEIDDQYIDEYLAENPTVSKAELVGQLNNACYLGLDCTNAIIMRQFSIGVCDTYVKKSLANTNWGQAWGDNFPTEENCPIDVIEHHARNYAFPVSDDAISFARAMWNEGNLTEKLS